MLPTMRPTALANERQQLYAQAVQHMGRRLQSAGDSRAMLTALRWGMAELDRTFAETPARVKATVACRAGCADCCSVPVDVQAHEVFFAAEYLQVNFSPFDLAGVIERTSAHRTRASGLGPDERDQLRQPCALLRDGCCSIYEGRPAACRAHHTSDAAVCAAHASDPRVDLAQVYIPALRSRMYAVMLGLDEAMEAAGFDERAYDFGSALHEALTNSLCQVLWLRRMPAFPDSCLADLPVNDESV
jgi:Fe-S-cluster containining protein